MLTNRAKALDGHACLMQIQANRRRRDLSRHGQTKPGCTNFVQRNAPNDPRQPNRTANFILDPGHTELIGAHIRAGNVVGQVAD